MIELIRRKSLSELFGELKEHRKKKYNLFVVVSILILVIEELSAFNGKKENEDVDMERKYKKELKCYYSSELQFIKKCNSKVKRNATSTTLEWYNALHDSKKMIKLVKHHKELKDIFTESYYQSYFYRMENRKKSIESLLL